MLSASRFWDGKEKFQQSDERAFGLRCEESLEKDKATANAKRDSLGAAARTELPQNRRHVKFHCVLGDRKPCGDFLVG